MNIFVLSNDHAEAARWHVDKHVSKMPLESAQLLCTNLNNINVFSPYKSAHVKHPCTLWVGQSRSNFMWLCDLGLELCAEYRYRYGREHACEIVIHYARSEAGKFADFGLTPFAQAMPDEYKGPCAIEAYRRYYVGGKTHLASWKGRPRPSWFPSPAVVGVAPSAPAVMKRGA
jgi:hypothetical protein